MDGRMMESTRRRRESSAYVEEVRRDAEGHEQREPRDRRKRYEPQGGKGVFYCTDEYHPIQSGSIDGSHFTPHDRGIKRAMIAREIGAYPPPVPSRLYHDSSSSSSSSNHPSVSHTRVCPPLPLPSGDVNPRTISSPSDAAEQPLGGARPSDTPAAPSDVAERQTTSAADPSCVLFVSRLQPGTCEHEIREAAERHGAVTAVRLVRNIATGAPRGYAFVHFSSRHAMERAYKHGLSLPSLSGAPVLVDFCRQAFTKGWIPRRFGGGLGGKKESGQMRFGGRDRPFHAPMRSIPSEELQQLGIHLPPEGRYLHRHDPPPLPTALSQSGRSSREAGLQHAVV